MILHVDMDAFFASIEQAINPRLKDKPLIVGSRGNKMHTVVCAASYAAKRLGIHSGMPSREAFQICPQLEFVSADQAKYIWTSERIFELVKGYGLPANYASIDEFQLDVSGHPDSVGLGEDIRKRICAEFNITASVGIARNWILAKLASKLHKPDGLTVIDEANLEQVLRKTPLDKLCGMGGKTGQALMFQGYESCWDLYLKMPAFFEGDSGGFGEGFSAGNERPKSVSHSYTLPRAERNPQVIVAWVRLLSEMVGTRLRQQGLAARTVHFYVSGPDMGSFGAQNTTQAATSDSYEIYLRCLKVLAKAPQGNPKIRALGVSVSQLTLQDYHPLLIEERRRDELIKALDRINGRFGDQTIFPAEVALTRK